MKKPALLVGGLMSACLLCGCANLSVGVQVLDRERIPAEKRLESNAWLLAQRYSSEVESGYYQRLQSTLIAELNALINMLFERRIVTNPAVRPQFEAGARDFAQEKIRAARQRSAEGLRLYESARDPAAPDRVARLEQALVALEDGRRQLNTMAATISRDLNQLLQSFPIDKEAFNASVDAINSAFDATRAIVESRHPLFGGTTLFNDPLASWVVTADPQAWTGTFNQSYGAGFFGNTDIAIKMEANGVFTLKGVRLDASKTTEATFAVIRQSLNVAAAGVGFPLPKAAPKTETTTATPDANPPKSPDVSTDLIRQADALEASERLQREQAQYALSVIFDVVARNASSIAGTDAQRRQAIEQIKAVYGAYKPLMQAPAKTEGSTP